MTTGMHAIVFSPDAARVRAFFADVLYLMCDDIHATIAELRAKGVEVTRDVSDQGWGLLTAIRLPDGGEFPIYQPRHPSPLPP
jgi:hypothetical protein